MIFNKLSNITNNWAKPHQSYYEMLIALSF